MARGRGCCRLFADNDVDRSATSSLAAWVSAITRRVKAVLLEQDDHWLLEGRPMVSLDWMVVIAAAADARPPQVQAATA